jgi:large exoprotein involved in heme utilization and adhesion
LISTQSQSPTENAGRIEITTPSLTIMDGAKVESNSFSAGRGGDVVINVQNLTMSAGGQIKTSSQPFFVSPEVPRGAGDIHVNATDTIALSGGDTGLFSETSGAGHGGNIALTAGQSVTIRGNASISSSSTGPGNAGNISINAGQQFDMRDSSVTAKAELASGGNIDIRAVDRVRLVNSEISSSVQGGASTAGGNITIDPNVVVLQNSQVVAQAVQGAGGNITIFTPLYLADSSSLVSASSQLGVNGTVTIQSPTSNVSGSLGPLTSKPSQAQALLTQRCAALASGQASSFIVAGREQLPSDPEGWLSSPLAFAALGESLDAGHAIAAAPAAVPIATHDATTVSLRRLTPTGFLMAHFADSEATGCHS